MPNNRGGEFFCRWALLLAGMAFGVSGPSPVAMANQMAFPASPETMRQIKPRSGKMYSKADLVERGRQIFENETFDGNGRTCATCHPADNNFTLDTKYIAKLRRDDPLFVAETDRRLARLEDSAMLRRRALITENVDGFDSPGVLRSVPHLLGLGLSMTPGPGFPLTDMTGWSGDGAPGNGSLREFAVGAVAQHLTKSLDREPGRDFRVPTEDELDALLAFQLSLGQQELLDVEPGEEGEMMFLDPAVEAGKNLFDTPAREGANDSCFACHYKAGANDEALDEGGHGNNFATGTATLSDTGDCRMPPDGGFGKDPVLVIGTSAGCGHRRGDGTFNVPSLVPAAATPPFFHNNSAATLEDAITFYTTETFADSPAGHGQAFALDTKAIQEIAAFLRAVNAYQNIVEAMEVVDQGTGRRAPSHRRASESALVLVNDAIKVLKEHRPAPLFASTHAADALYAAQAKLSRSSSGQLAAAKVDLARALSLMAR